MGVEDGAATEPLRLAEQALRRGDTAEALRLLSQAEAAAPDDPAPKLQMALALRMRGDFAGALAELDRALVADPYSLMAHLSKGFVLEKLGRRREAVGSYQAAAQIAPPDAQLPAQLKAPLARAREAVAQQTKELDDFVAERLEPVRARHSGEMSDRFDICRDLLLGKRKVYYPEPINLNFPFLPPYQFHPREPFPWLDELEAATDMIGEELAEVARERRGDFGPYIQFRPGEPVNQWAELNQSTRWSSFFLWKDGARIDEHCGRCPRTSELLSRLPMADLPGYAPTAMFSVLDPKTRIPPHTGSTNVRLIVHLPLVLPGRCFFRVGNETRAWKLGQAWVFDDTIEHEAWNDSEEERIILIFDVWNPHLTAAERELVTALLVASKDFIAG